MGREATQFLDCNVLSAAQGHLRTKDKLHRAKLGRSNEEGER